MEIKGSATTADLHLRNYIWSSRPRIKDDAIISMQYVFDYCIQNRLSLKLAGDIFHTLAVLPDFVAPLFACLDRMQEANLPVYYIQGNHDNNMTPWLSLHKWPISLEGITQEIKGTNEIIHGIGYTDSDSLVERLKLVSKDKAINTLLMHQAEKQAMPFNHNFELSWVPDNIRLVLIGDIHKAQSYSLGRTNLIYPGSPSVTDISQVETRTFTVETAEGANTIARFEQIPGRGVYRIDVKTDNDIPKAIEEVKRVAATDKRYFNLEPIVRIVYAPALSEKVSQIFLPMRDAFSVYTWLDVKSAEDSLQHTFQCTSSTQDRVNVMHKVISDNVPDPLLRDILMRLFSEEDTQAILMPELEKIL